MTSTAYFVRTSVRCNSWLDGEHVWFFLESNVDKTQEKVCDLFTTITYELGTDNNYSDRSMEVEFPAPFQEIMTDRPSNRPTALPTDGETGS